MRIAVYSPYIPKHRGGGEKHFFDVVKVLAKHHQVSVALPAAFGNTISSNQAKLWQNKYESLLGEPLGNVNWIPSPLGTAGNPVATWWWTHQFDAIYFATDGSLFLSGAKTNLLHLQVPYTQSLSLIDRLKLSSWNRINTNSEFTKNLIEKAWKIKVPFVLYPSVDVSMLSKAAFDQKQKVVLNVGRFFRQLHSKRQDVLVKMWQQLLTEYPTQAAGWKLVMIGSVEDESYFSEVKLLAKDYPIEFITEVSRDELVAWYQKASLYWHATGYGADQETEPEKMEHFGISTVEAMAAGCVPMVYAAGGQLEVLGHLQPACGWLTQSEAVAKTAKLMTAQQNKTAEFLRLQSESQVQAQNFSPEKFESTLNLMLKETV